MSKSAPAQNRGNVRATGAALGNANLDEVRLINRMAKLGRLLESDCARYYAEHRDEELAGLTEQLELFRRQQVNWPND